MGAVCQDFLLELLSDQMLTVLRYLTWRLVKAKSCLERMVTTYPVWVFRLVVDSLPQQVSTVVSSSGKNRLMVAPGKSWGWASLITIGVGPSNGSTETLASWSSSRKSLQSSPLYLRNPAIKLLVYIVNSLLCKCKLNKQTVPCLSWYEVWEQQTTSLSFEETGLPHLVTSLIH